jgi:hypothetical protein
MGNTCKTYLEKDKIVQEMIKSKSIYELIDAIEFYETISKHPNYFTTLIYFHDINCIGITGWEFTIYKKSFCKECGKNSDKQIYYSDGKETAIEAILDVYNQYREKGL